MTPRPTLARRFLLAAAALSMAGCALFGHGGGTRTVDPGVPGDPMGVTIHRLSNGMTVMLSENHEEARVEAWITVRAGGAKDPPDATGMAHYLEHMQFKGTTRLGTTDWEKEKPHLDRITALYEQLFKTTDVAQRKELYSEIDRENQEACRYAIPNELDHLYKDELGAKQDSLNANTSNDQTNYVVDIPSNRLRQWAEVETERLREPVYRLFQSELEAVYEEKNQSIDSAGRATFEKLMRAMFPNHPYGTQTVLGHVEHLKNPSLTHMYDFFHRWYVPGNMCVELAGDFDTQQALGILEDTLGKLPAKPFPEDPKFDVASPKGVTRVDLTFKGEETVLVAYPIPPDTHPDHDALVLCDMMLANGQTGLIDVNLNQAQRVRSASCNPVLFLEGGMQLLSATPKKDQSLDELEALLLEQVEHLKKGEFADEDLPAVITEFEIQRKRGLESNNNRVAEMAHAFVAREPWEREVHAIDRLKKLGKADIVAAANKYFGDDRVVVRRTEGQPELPSIQKPNFTKVEIDATRHSEWFKALAAQPVPAVEPRFLEKGRDVEEVAMRSGTLVYTRNPVNDVFDLSFTIPVGTDREPKLSLALALLDFAGAGDMDGVAFKRKLYMLGSTIGAGASRDETTISVSGLESNLGPTLDLLRQHFEKPAGVGQEVLDALVGRVLKGRANQKSQPQAIAGALQEYARRGAESATLHAPRNEELKSWKAADLFGVARDLWKFRRTVTYVGQLTSAQVAMAVDLPPIGGSADAMVDAPARKPVSIEKTATDRVLIVDQATAQTSLQITTPDGTFDRTQVPSWRVWNEMMGGSMSGIVFQEIRESRSLSYDPFAMYRGPAWREDDNFLYGSMRTQADKTADAVEAMLGLFRRWPGTPERFDGAVRSIDLAYRTNRIGFRQIPATWVTWKRQGLDGDPRPYNWEHVRSMKYEDLVAWASRFEKAPFTIALCGPKSKMDLGRIGKFGEIRDVKVSELFAW